MSLTLDAADDDPDTKGTSEKDKKVQRDARSLLCKQLCRQWPLLLIGFPFIFLASISDMFVPDYTGKIVDAFTEENYEGKDGVH